MLHIEWHGREFEQHLRKATAQGLHRATTYLHAECRRAVSKPNTGQRVKVKKQTKGGNKRSRTIYPNPSKPGEPPKLRTGFGARNVVMEFSRAEMVGRVGVTKNGIYMFYLEVGTRKIKRRPWLLATLLKHQATIAKLAATGKD